MSDLNSLDEFRHSFFKMQVLFLWCFLAVTQIGKTVASWPMGKSQKSLLINVSLSIRKVHRPKKNKKH